MEEGSIPQDDILDVLQLTTDLEAAMFNVLKDSPYALAVSALMNASISCILAQCDTIDEAILYRNIFMEIFDRSIRSIQIKDKETPF